MDYQHTFGPVVTSIGTSVIPGATSKALGVGGVGHPVAPLP